MKLLLPALTALALTACGAPARLSEGETIGVDPTLPPPHDSLIPVVDIAPAVGWPRGDKPVAAPGTAVNAFATGLDHPRWLYVLPNGDVLVAETNAPKKPDDAPGGLKAWVMGLVLKKAGAAVPSADRITLLRDTDGDGVAELKTPLLQKLHSPFGMALVNGRLYVANADAIVSVPYREGDTKIDAAPVKLTDLPAGLNHHWTKNIVPSPDGRKLYATVGSNSNVGENGMDIEQGRAAIWEVDLARGDKRLFATGLRNPNGIVFEPTTGAMWTVVNERDELGSDLVPDYLTSVRDGAFYGWPYSYWGQHVDPRPKPQRPDLVARAVRPDYALGNHVAPLGLAWSDSAALPASLRGGVFVGLHGSWNRTPLAGYKVVFIPFADGKPSGPPRDVLSGFVSPDGNAYGRPVGVAIDKRGALLVADDVGNTVWRASR